MKRIIRKLINPDKPTSDAQLQRETRELQRLESLIDGVFALVIVLVTLDLPPPIDGEEFELTRYVVMRLEELILAALGIAVVLVYWFQSNLLLGNLVRTDGRHGAICVFQVFLVLLYLLSVSLGLAVGNDPIVLALQSSVAALVGFAAAAAWWYASSNRRLLSDEIQPVEIAALRLRVLAEPLTAVFTLLLAFVDSVLWELGWLTYPVLVIVLRRVGIAGGEIEKPIVECD